jgi:hypothetical protein
MWKHYNLTHVSLALHIHHADEKTSCHQQPDDDFQTPKFLGSDGTRKSISKWCKGSMTAGSATANTNRGNLVAVGHDGRGGKVKILRPWPIPSQFNKLVPSYSLSNNTNYSFSYNSSLYLLAAG